MALQKALRLGSTAMPFDGSQWLADSIGLQNDGLQHIKKLWENANFGSEDNGRCSAGIPGYFKPMLLKPKSAYFDDGGLRYNNPVGLVINESKRIWEIPKTLDIVLSIGTGYILQAIKWLHGFDIVTNKLCCEWILVTITDSRCRVQIANLKEFSHALSNGELQKSCDIKEFGSLIYELIHRVQFKGTSMLRRTDISDQLHDFTLSAIQRTSKVNELFMDAVTVQAPQTYFTFLKLPPEIRNEIYKYLLDSNQCDISDIDGVEKIHFSANILRTNCLIYSEAHYLLYRANGPVVTISLGLAEAHQYMEEHLVCAYDTRYPAAIKGKLLHIEAVLSLSSMLYRRSIVVVGMKNAMGLANSLRLSMFNGNMKAKYNFDFQRPQTCLGHHYSYDGDESAQQAIMDFFYGIQTPFADSTVSGALNKQSGHRFLAMINSPIVWGRLHSFEKAQMCLQLFNEANDFFLAHRFAFAVRRYRRVIRDFTDGFINCILMSSFEPFESNSKCTKLVSEIILSSHHNLLLCYIEKFKDSCSGTVNMDEEEKAKIVHAVKEAHKILFSMPKKKVLDDLHRAIDAQIIPDGDTRNIHQHLDIARSSYTKRSGLQNESRPKVLVITNDT
ncbi:hypothetical protein Dda_7416 [Drechslerella dactyloides]|uniref:PNPLA domain-containing protein n=1 Tax=Drechslerella dactyloides TaxID=74499 RepID=A0AAD6ITB9_DREDA|nr:hypothetical protein Dda_7416 [Drechslerella dactyloides]